jgi:hypothetical protein
LVLDSANPPKIRRVFVRKTRVSVILLLLTQDRWKRKVEMPIVSSAESAGAIEAPGAPGEQQRLLENAADARFCANCRAAHEAGPGNAVPNAAAPLGSAKN